MVGSAIVRNLASKGYKNLLARTHAELDLTDQAAVKTFFEQEKPDQVYLAAARVGGIHANNTFPAEFIYDNLMVQNNVIHQAFLSGVKKLLFLRSVSLGGADGRLSGMNGSINAASTERVLRLLRANVICDVGAAEGKFMMCAAISGIRKVIGVELTENIGYKMVLDAAVHHMRLRYGVEFTLDWIPRAVEEVRTTMESFSYC